MKQFDEEFSRKSKEAFDNFNADHLAEEGWNSYIKKYGKRPSRPFIIPLWAKVASVAALLAVAVLLTNRVTHPKAGEPGNKLARENREELTGPAVNKEDTAAASPVIANPGKGSETTVSQAGPSRQTAREKTGYQVMDHAGPVLAETVNGEKSRPNEADEAAGSHLNQADKTAGLILTETAASEAALLAEASAVGDMSAGMNLPGNPIEIRLIDDSDTGLKLKPGAAHKYVADIPRERMTTTIMTGLSGMMASIDNTTSASQGVSIGFYVDRQLTRRISVRPGLAMARHNYGIESTSGGGVAMDYSAPELNGLSGTTTSYEANIEVVSMEVPVNFVFSLRKRSGSNLFFSTGASTVIYLNQHLSGSFNNTYTKSIVDAYSGQVSYESMTTSVKIESEKEPLGRVDVLGLANFSAGYSLPFIKTSHILFEPFVQLPLKDLTSLDLRIRYGGLSMKIQF
ncbi:hypothetical protein EG830_05615 [bacterium]|nr:hypothetical protein [bacterium]